MEKIDLTQQFSHRLREALISAGCYSQRSTAGVDIHKLVEITGYSSQICRKYLRGEAIPGPAKLVEIARNLHVSPGWLLFGEGHNDNHTSTKNITISRNLLQYIFSKANSLYNGADSSQDIADFLMDLSNDISQINASEEQLKKIVDLTLVSARNFSHGSR